jgi:pimeloyl-ACP methyl ester carboxylesterase
MRCSARGKGEAILFIHGLPTNGRLWDEVVRYLAGSFRCFVVDLPGMGGSPFLPYSPSYFIHVAAQIEQVRIRHHVQRWHVVGHDGGCAIALQYAHLFPKRVSCMAMLSPAIFADLKPFFLLELLRRRVIGEIAAPLVHALFWRVAMKRAIPDAKYASHRLGFQENFSGCGGPWKLMRLVRWGKPEKLFRDSPTILNRLACPTLVIHGSRDILPESFARRAASCIAQSRLIEVESGHFIPFEQSSLVARHLMSFFKSRGTECVRPSSRIAPVVERLSPEPTAAPLPGVAFIPHAVAQ